MSNAIVIYSDRVERVVIPTENSLSKLQELVGGYIESVGLPEAFDKTGRTTAYVNEEGKYTCQPNMAATDFMVPGVGLFPGDYIAGPFVLVGFDPNTGEHTPDLPDDVMRRVRVIAREAFGQDIG